MNWELFRQVFRRLLTAVMFAAALLASVISALGGTRISGPLRIGLIAGAALLATVSAMLIIRDHLHLPAEQNMGRPRPEKPVRAELEAAVGDVSKRYSATAIRYMFWAVTGSDSYLTRVDERAELERNTLRITTELTLLIDETYRRNAEDHANVGEREAGIEGQRPGTLLVPLMMTTKGKLLDGLEIKGSSGDILPSLSQYETRGLLAIIVNNLFLLARLDHAFEHGENVPPGSVPQLDSDELAIMWRVITEYVCRVGRPTDPAGRNLTAEELDHELRRWIDHPKLAEHFGIEWLERIKSICLGLANNYLIVVEVPLPSSNHLVATYSQLLPIESNTYDRRDFWRVRLGLSPRKLDAPISRALEADSYHFQMQAEPGMYVYDHHLERLNTGQVVKQDDLRLGGVQQYARAYYDDARTNAHLYIRRQGQVQNSSYPDLKSVIEMIEIPPGILGSAAVLAVVNAIVILFVAITNLGLDVRGSRVDNGAAIAALLLAVPAFVAAFIGNWTDRNLIQRSSLKAYGGLLLTMLLSFSSALLYLYNSYNRLPGSFTMSFAAGEAHWTVNALWVAFGLVSFVLASYLAQEVSVQSRYYLARMRAKVAKQSARG